MSETRTRTESCCHTGFPSPCFGLRFCLFAIICFVHSKGIEPLLVSLRGSSINHSATNAFEFSTLPCHACTIKILNSLHRAPEGGRTLDSRIKGAILYQLSYGRNCISTVVHQTGFEPVHRGWNSMCIPLLYPLSYKCCRYVYSLHYLPQVLNYLTNVFPIVVPVRTFLCSRFFGCPCYRYTQIFHTLSNNISYWFSLSFQIFYIFQRTFFVFFMKIKNPNLSNRVYVKHKISLFLHYGHIIPDSYKFFLI